MSFTGTHGFQNNFKHIPREKGELILWERKCLGRHLDELLPVPRRTTLITGKSPLCPLDGASKFPRQPSECTSLKAGLVTNFFCSDHSVGPHTTRYNVTMGGKNQRVNSYMQGSRIHMIMIRSESKVAPSPPPSRPLHPLGSLGDTFRFSAT